MNVLTWTVRHAMAAPDHFSRIRTTGVSYSFDSDGSVLLTFSSRFDAESFMAAIRAVCIALGCDDVA